MSYRATSSRRKIVVITTVIFIPMLLFCICYTFFSLKLIAGNSAAASSSLLENYKTELESNLRSIENELSYTIAFDYRFQNLGKKQNELDAFLHAVELQMQNTELMATSGIIGSISVYSEANHLFQSNSLSSVYDQQQKEDIFLAARRLAENRAESAQPLWTPMNVDGGNFLLRVFGRTIDGNITAIVCVVDLDRWAGSLAAHSHLRDGENVLVLHNSAGDISTGRDQLNQLGANLRVNGSGGDYYFTGKPLHMAVANTSDQANISLALLTEFRPFHDGKPTDIMVMLLFALLLVFTAPLAYRLLHRSIVRPLEEMTGTMEAIATGDMELRMQEQFPVTELNAMSLTFNDMLEQIKGLKIESYEKIIRARELQLQFLQMQINPHFFLSCLKSLYGLAQENDRTRMQEMIIGISNYYRSMIRVDIEKVTVEHELQSIRNYMNLLALSAYQPIQYEVEVSGELSDMYIPPLSLLTFVENSVKHGMRPDEPLRIRIEGSLLNSEEGPAAWLRIADNGRGMTQTVLDELNRPVSFDAPANEKQVGIDNVKKRLELMYGEQASIIFHSSNNGVDIEIRIVQPAIRKEEEHS